MRMLVIAGIALGAHGLVLAIRGLSRRALGSRLASEAKARTLTGFATSLAVFAIYFGAAGFALGELGVSLATYLAGASVIGLAVSFGSQGVVQDVISGLTVLLTDVLDVGDMVEIGGEVGIVESMGMRFTVLVNAAGARVFVPNRNVAAVVNHPAGFTRVHLDVRLEGDPALAAPLRQLVERTAAEAYRQYRGVVLLPPVVELREDREGSGGILRVEFRIWPGQDATVEGPVRTALVQRLRSLEPAFADWRVSVQRRAEPAPADAPPTLPRPAAVAAREPQYVQRPSR